MPLALAVSNHLLNSVIVFITEFSIDVIYIQLLSSSEVPLLDQFRLDLAIGLGSARIAIARRQELR
jgi:hypothetical protein